jgi:hypothetical protein
MDSSFEIRNWLGWRLVDFGFTTNRQLQLMFSFQYSQFPIRKQSIIASH